MTAFGLTLSSNHSCTSYDCCSSVTLTG